LRGTKYTIPDAKPGRAKGQLKGGTGLVLREDQAEWQDAVRSQRIKKQKEEKKAANGVLNGWDDPDVSPR
jgi:RNA-binding protein NOB1